ncbi:ABZJ_00895 family protein [Kordiimonas sp.]|uniref:ABZJ_00895 family protein n=1 Tax=Kordiimonas sp. TaxID=1970157 RepID=UPI003A958D67
MADNTTPSGTPARLMPTIGTFAVWYICAMLALTGVSLGLGINFGRLGSIAILLLSGFFAGVRFAKDHERELEGTEKWKLALGCLLVSYLCSAANIVAITLATMGEGESARFMDALTNMPLDVWAFVFALVSLFYYLGLVLFIGLGVKNGLPLPSENSGS